MSKKTGSDRLLRRLFEHRPLNPTPPTISSYFERNAMSFLHLPNPQSPPTLTIAPLAPLRQWINTIEVRNIHVAQWICRLIPNTCSAGYDLRLLGRTWLHIPALCKLTPFQDELFDLRFRAADFLYEHTHPTA
ncbi:MAG: Mo-dependent nitrogenase C-terminal domain-containing protein [Cyanobacteria bacterium P01_A01_bin.123]